MKPVRLQLSRLVAGLLLLGLGQKLTPTARAQDPAWLKFDGIPEPRIGLEVEGSHEVNKVGGAKSTYDQMSITPTVGLMTSGSIYHPNLCTFNLNGDLGWGWDETKSSSSGSSQSQNNSSDLKRYLAQLNFLQAKPYNANFFAAQDHSYQDYGSFSTLTMDSTRYGGAFNWFNQSFTLNADAGWWDEKNYGLSEFSEISQNYFNLVGVNHRENGQTTFTTRAATYENTLDSNPAQTSQNVSAGLADAESFGDRKHISLSSSLAYSQSRYSGQHLHTVTANESLRINHTPDLDSFGMANFDYNDYGDTSTDRARGNYGLQHQLYESLTSTVDAHGDYEKTDSGPGNSSTYEIYGAGGSENYTKKLGSWGRLSIGLGLLADHQDNDITGSTISTINELHILTLSGSPVYLDHPYVIQSTVAVYGPGHVLASPSIDYLLVTVGALTQIQLVPTSVILQNGGPITVDYQSDSQPSSSYESLTGNFQIRLDLFDGWGIYSRVSWVDNNAPPQAMTQTLTDWVSGLDYTWRWLRTGVEYEDYDSSYTAYRAGRAFQTFTFNPAINTTLGLNLSESVYEYSGDGSQTQYQMLGQYRVQFLESLSLFANAGFIYQDVMSTSQLTGTAQTGVSWTRGKMSVNAGYDFSEQRSGSGQNEQEFSRSHFYAYMKRTF